VTLRRPRSAVSTTLREHALLALEHGIAIHRASLEWVRSAMAALGETSCHLGLLRSRD
jgi:hypothetical protein